MSRRSWSCAGSATEQLGRDHGVSRAGQDGEESAPGRPSPVRDAGDEARDEEDEAVLALARRAAAEHQGAHGQPITRDTLRARLGVSNQAASELLRQLRAGEGQPPGTSRAA